MKKTTMQWPHLCIAGALLLLLFVALWNKYQAPPPITSVAPRGTMPSTVQEGT